MSSKKNNILGLIFTVIIYSGIFFTNWVYGLIGVFGLCLHELAHYIYAKKSGLYKGVIINPLFFSIKMSGPGSKESYLYGFLSSLLVLPLTFILPWELSTFPLWKIYLSIAILASVGDFSIFIFYNKVRIKESSKE